MSDYYIIYTNPTHHEAYDHIPSQQLINACGLLPAFAINAAYAELPLKGAMEAQYPYGLIELQDALVEPDGVFKYDGDPDQHPLVMVERGDEILYIYEHGMVAFVNPVEKTTYVTRMD